MALVALEVVKTLPAFGPLLKTLLAPTKLSEEHAASAVVVAVAVTVEDVVVTTVAVSVVVAVKVSVVEKLNVVSTSAGTEV